MLFKDIGLQNPQRFLQSLWVELETSSAPSSFDLQAAFVTEGEGVPLGVLRAGEIGVPAFGPQAFSLSDPELFGMDRILSNQRWGRVSAQKDVWFEVKSDLTKGYLEIGFYGYKPDRPLFFVFYIQADQALLEKRAYFPKTLDRYKGISKRVTFNRGKSLMGIEGQELPRMDLISLAGGECFWGADFLLAFEAKEKITFHLESRSI